MNGVNRTLYIPLYGKAYVSALGLFLKDSKAEEIWAAEGFELKSKSKSKWLAYYMGIRAAVFDDWIRQRLREAPDAVAIHIGCGMDSRVMRVGTMQHKWYDVDFPAVIQERKRYFSESTEYQMVAGDVTDGGWLKCIPESKCAVVAMEGVSMYLTNRELRDLFETLSGHFEQVVLLMDCYTSLAARLTRYKNPIHDVGVTQVYGMDDPGALQNETVEFVKEHSMTPLEYIDELNGFEKFVFRNLYAGRFAKKLYRLYEYRKASL